MNILRNKKHVIVCDAEVGKPGNWHSCGKVAKWRLSEHTTTLDYCTKHKDRIGQPHNSFSSPVKVKL